MRAQMLNAFYQMAEKCVCEECEVAVRLEGNKIKVIFILILIDIDECIYITKQIM